MAVLQLWDLARRANRRIVVRRALYEAWYVLIAQDPIWVGDRGALSGYFAAG